MMYVSTEDDGGAMKRWIWLALAAAVVIGAGVTLVALPSEQEWTTDSPEALAVFEDGVDAMYKLYHEDSYRLFVRASELDPDFVMAKLWSVHTMKGEDKDKAKAEALIDAVMAADTTSLTVRERYFVEMERAVREERREEIPNLLDEALAQIPSDPYLINEKAVRAFSTGDWEGAEQLYRRLAEIAPNWVIAYNQLGYINMSKGRFAEAEERFKSYRFIAPDQANPYDSLGELFIILGRNDEAEQSLEKAIEIKPIFWDAYEHIALLKSFNGDLEGTREIIDRARTAGMPEGYVKELDCLEQFMGLRNTGSWREILALAESSECIEKDHINFPKTTTHLAACELGEWDTALKIEQEAENVLASFEEKGSQGRGLDMLRAAMEHLEGVRLALQGDYDDAEALMRAADQRLRYHDSGTAIFKLYNRMILAELLLADGQDAEAHGLLAKVRDVNQVWVAEFEDSGHKIIGLQRG
jgi:Flp pilus assembly protein TadD